MTSTGLAPNIAHASIRSSKQWVLVAVDNGQAHMQCSCGATMPVPSLPQGRRLAQMHLGFHDRAAMRAGK